MTEGVIFMPREAWHVLSLSRRTLDFESQDEPKWDSNLIHDHDPALRVTAHRLHPSPAISDSPYSRVVL